jgi:putative endonuclease
MTTARAKRGAQGEQIAADFLAERGFDILHRNLRLSRYEIDIVCRDGECLVFVEVKRSVRGTMGHPATWISEKKQEHLRRAAELYIEKYHVSDTDIRFDAVTIVNDRVEDFPNAF